MVRRQDCRVSAQPHSGLIRNSGARPFTWYAGAMQVPQELQLKEAQDPGNSNPGGNKELPTHWLCAGHFMGFP